MVDYKIGDIVTGKVTGIESYGIFLSFTDNYIGLIPADINEDNGYRYSGITEHVVLL